MKTGFFFAIPIFLGVLLPFSGAQAATYYTVLAPGISDIIVTDGSSSYKISYSFDCYSSDFSAGETILIDSSFYPSYGDKIVVQGLTGTKACEVTYSDDLNLKPYYVTKVLDSSDDVILEDKFGDQFLVEYGIGCLSMWRYEGKTIHVDIGGTFLDGISDQIYLFDSDDSCKVWDAEELGSSGSYGASPPSYAPTSASYQSTCPLNSHESPTDSTKCQCDTGYQTNAKQNGCVLTPTKTNDQVCQADFGINVSWDGTKTSDGNLNCNCKSGYQWNDGRTACIVQPPPVNAGAGVGGTEKSSCDKPVLGQITHFGVMTADECYATWQKAVAAKQTSIKTAAPAPQAVIKEISPSITATLEAKNPVIASPASSSPISTSTPPKTPLWLQILGWFKWW